MECFKKFHHRHNCQVPSVSHLRLSSPRVPDHQLRPRVYVDHGKVPGRAINSADQYEKHLLDYPASTYFSPHNEDQIRKMNEKVA
jgi:hypothetical protein